MKIFLVLALLFSSLVTHAADSVVKVEYDPPQKLDAKYRLFKTDNTWNFLELDTQTGKVWQVQFSVDSDANRIKIPINTEVLAKEGKTGRFTLYPTKNTYNFILLDQDNGNSWQVQFSTDVNQMIKPINEANVGYKGERKTDVKPTKSDTSWSQ